MRKRMPQYPPLMKALDDLRRAKHAFIVRSQHGGYSLKRRKQRIKQLYRMERDIKRAIQNLKEAGWIMDVDLEKEGL